MTEHIITKIANLEINDSKGDDQDPHISSTTGVVVDVVDATTNPIPEGLTDDIGYHVGESDEINSVNVQCSVDEYCQALWLTGC